MDSLNKLTQYFSKFPGIGPRQSKRFVYHLLRQNKAHLNELAKTIAELKDDIRSCTLCRQYFFTKNKQVTLCSICSDASRDNSLLMIVEKDTDLESIEKSGIYHGYYFVLGGQLSALEKSPETKVRKNELLHTVEHHAKNDLEEIVIATSINPDGEGTMRYVSEELEPLSKKYSFTISTLGRGLSTGTELEYIDADTMKSAFENRS